MAQMRDRPWNPELPDPPWIGGPPEPEPVCCPVCEEECEEIYLDIDGNAVGCDCCISSQDAGDWYREEQEKAKEAWIDHLIDERRDMELDGDDR